MNALGLPSNLDIVPDFDSYINAYTSFSPLVLGFFDVGVSLTLASEQLAGIQGLLKTQHAQAVAAEQDATADRAIAQTEHGNAQSEAVYLQKQLDDVTTQIKAALPAMQSASFNLGAILGTVAEIASAVVSVAAAIPTLGASLVALVPDIIAITNSVLDSTQPLTKTLFKADDSDDKAVKDAYKAVGQDVKSIEAGGKAIVNFVNLVQTLDKGTTPQNAQYLALVKQGADLTHQVLLARNQVILAGQRTAAVEARVGRAQSLVTITDAAGASIPPGDPVAIRAAGLQAIQAALEKVDSLLKFAFFAQRSLEIYTLQKPVTPLALDAGWISPEIWQSYQEGKVPAGDLLAHHTQAWQKLLQPTDLKMQYVNYLQQSGFSKDTLSLIYNDPASLEMLRSTGTFRLRVDLSRMPPDHIETKIRTVNVALVGAHSQSGLLSCDVKHSGLYEQIGPNGTPEPLFLEAKVWTVQAQMQPLTLGPVSPDPDPPLSSPSQIPFWGRGVGGDWEIHIPPAQPNGMPADLSAVSQIEIWISYQFRHASGTVQYQVDARHSTPSRQGPALASCLMASKLRVQGESPRLIGRPPTPFSISLGISTYLQTEVVESCKTAILSGWLKPIPLRHLFCHDCGFSLPPACETGFAYK